MNQQALYKIAGMQKDVANSAMDKQHAFDIRNMRLRNSDTNTVTALVNELGNKKAKDASGMFPSIRGTVIGFNTLNNIGILFTHEESDIGYINSEDMELEEQQSPSMPAVLRSPSEELEDATDRLCNYTVNSVQHYGSFEHELISTVNGTATMTVVITKFMNSEYYAVGGSGDSEKVYISSDNSDVTFTHGTTGSSLRLTQNDILAVNNEDSPVPYTFTVNFSITQTLRPQTVHRVVEIRPYTSFPSPVRIGFQVYVPARTVPDPDPEDPESGEEPEEITTGSGVICDYEEELNLSQCDHIYLVTIGSAATRSVESDPTVNVFEYFRGCLRFSTEHPIESTVYFENDEIQKVYWVDGINPLRYANIADKNGDTYWTDNLMFDSVPLLHLQETVKISRNSTGGVFPSGTIQWCFTYLNRYGAESNIAWISGIHYSSPDDRGGKPGENCSNSFTLRISNYEPNGRFDYIRLYHIVHTTLDAQPEVRRVADIAVPDGKQDYTDIVFTDTNTTGETVDPNELLYLDRNNSIIPNTIEQKSNTLFLGNLKQSIDHLRDIIEQMNADNIIEGEQTDIITWGNEDVDFYLKDTDIPADVKSGYYSHRNQLVSDSWNITSFRRGEVYRFGIQAQDKTGRWSDVWWVGDVENTDKYPTFDEGKLKTVYAGYTLSSKLVDKLRELGYRKVRPVAVYPKPWERNILTEGLLNPTVYNVKDRAGNAPFAQSSWFLRPFPPIDLPTLPNTDDYGNVSNMVYPETSEFISRIRLGQDWPKSMSYLAIDSPYFLVDDDLMSIDLSQYGSWAEFRHNHPLGDSQQRNAEVQSMYNPRTGNGDSVSATYTLNMPYVPSVGEGIDVYDEQRKFINNWSDFFYVDQSILTMNSADIEFDQVMQAQDIDDYSFRVVGIIPMTSFVSSYDILTNTPPNKFYTDKNDSMLIPQGLYGSEIVGAKMEACGHGWKSMLSSSIWHDDLAYNSFTDNDTGDYDNTAATPVGFAVYPWQGTGSMNNDSIGSRRVYPSDNDDSEKKESKSNTGDNYISAELKTKVVANLHYSYRTHPITNLSDAFIIGAKAGTVLNEQQVTLTKLEVNNCPDKIIHYFGHVDKLIIPATGSFSISTTPASDANAYDAYQVNSGRLNRKGGYPKMASFLPYLAHGFGTDSSGHLAFMSPYTPIGYPNTLFASSYLRDLGYPHGSGHSGKWLPSDMKDGADRSMASIAIKYHSCNHLVVALDYKSASGIYQKCVGWFKSSIEGMFDETMPFWTTGLDGYEQIDLFKSTASFDGVDLWHSSFDCIEFDKGESDNIESVCGYLYMGQLCRTDEVSNRFGGNSDEALEQNVWLPAGKAVYLASGENAIIKWTAGDTYYQRYDALRTYPFTEEDVNKVVDIVSFMTETHINIDGRYDKNRGLTNNLHCRPTNFNLMNYVYSQTDNFFSYSAINSKKVHLDTFNYSFTWSLTKAAGALRDEWTRITLANTYDCDGNKGQLNRIVRLDNNLITFQDGGVAQILFNENVQIQGSEGIPIELANSGKLQGLRYYTTEMGCQNKWSIAVMPNGIYWIDGRSRDFCMLGEGIVSVSASKLMSTWFRNRTDLGISWAPKSDSWSGFFTHRDITTNELFISSGDVCLGYDTLVGEFTSFYDYQKTDAMFALEGHVITAAKDRRFNPAPGIILNDNLWLHRANKETSCSFYGKQYPFWVEIICNSNNQGSDYGFSKIFDNMSWRSDAWQWSSDGSWVYQPFITVTELYGKDDYQTFRQVFTNTYPDGKQTSHPSMPLNLRKKFKVWYTTLPRSEESKSEARPTGVDRICDTWCHITLMADTSVSHYRHILHDISVTYFIP